MNNQVWEPTTAELVRSYLKAAGDFRTAAEIAQAIGRSPYQVRAELQNQLERERVRRELPTHYRPQRYRWVA